MIIGNFKLLFFIIYSPFSVNAAICNNPFFVKCITQGMTIFLQTAYIYGFAFFLYLNPKRWYNINSPFGRFKKRKEVLYMAIKITQNNFEEIIAEGKPVLVDFYADWCGPCRMVGPIVEEIAAENPDIVVAKVNVDNNPELASEFGVFSIPTMVVLKDGKVAAKSAGARPKAQILQLVNG